MSNYKIVEMFGTSTVTLNNLDGSVSFIPMNESNSDYQRYLRWLENPDADEFTPQIASE